MASGVVGSTLNTLQIAATLSGVPFAAGTVLMLQSINDTCSRVALHKRKTSQLLQRCTALLNLINEQCQACVGMEVTGDLDEVEVVLSMVNRRMQRWSRCGRFKRLREQTVLIPTEQCVRTILPEVNNGQIERDLDKSCADVTRALELFHLKNPLTIMKIQHHSLDMMRQHQKTMEDGFQQLLTRAPEVERAVQSSGDGNSAGELLRMMQAETDSSSPINFVLGGAVVDSPPSSPLTTVQDQHEQALLDLRLLENIPRNIWVLNNQIKITAIPARCSRYSAIFEGHWSGVKVALKTLTMPDESDPKAKKLQMRFQREINVWSKLSHENILTLYGIVTNLGPIHIVSPWQENDTVLTYRFRSPGVDPLKLLSQAARGLEYLHANQIVHGHMQCSNLLVSSTGVVTVCDFGFTQVLTEVVGKEAMTLLTSTSAIRWHAPELVVSDEADLTMPADVFAFGMCILELLTQKRPYSNRKRDISVVQDIQDGRLPLRPSEPEAMPWMTDALWSAVRDKCWALRPEARPTASELSPCLEEVSASLSQQTSETGA